MPDAERTPADAMPIRVTLITLDNHLGSAVQGAERRLREAWPGLTLSVFAAADWTRDPDQLARCRAEVARADIIVATMIFMDDQIRAIRPALEARSPHCDAMVGCFSAGEIVRLTKLGPFRMDGTSGGVVGLLKRLRGEKGKGGAKAGGGSAAAGARQMAMLRRLPKILRFVPGQAQDLRAYFLTLQYFLAGSEENIAELVRLLVGRYASGPRAVLKGAKAQAPIAYPETGVYHPALPGRIGEDAAALPAPAEATGVVGLLLMRSYVLAGDTAHYDAVIAALEGRGLRVIPAFAAGLDARPAAERFFRKADGGSAIDMLVSLTGFSLVGGPAYAEAGAAEALLADLDVPCLAAHALEFQTLEEWRAGAQGLTPVEATMMVALPELDGAISPIVYGGRTAASLQGSRAMEGNAERIARLAGRVASTIALRRTANAGKRVAIVLFNYPPNAGEVGTAAFLDVFASLHVVLRRLKAEGYEVDVPEDAAALREGVVGAGSGVTGLPARVHHRVSTAEHVRREPHLDAIERQWGPAPGRQQLAGGEIAVLGAQFGQVFVGVQPAFGYEGDPMRLLFEEGFAPTHAFSAFYRYLREDFGAHAVLHFGTHGALEFMPGKQAGLSGDCWPERLIGDLPNLYLYAANNPSEGLIAKRRSGAVLLSHLTPPVTRAGLYKGLAELKASLERWRGASEVEGPALLPLIQAQAAALDLARAEPPFADPAADITGLRRALAEVETSLIPFGLTVAGEAPAREARRELLAAMADAQGSAPSPEALDALADGLDIVDPALQPLAAAAHALREPGEVDAIVRALQGRYIRPVKGGDVLRSPDILPTGRNLHGFDPYRLPSAAAFAAGQAQAERLLDRHACDGGGVPESVALVLWGSDNLKTEGQGLSQALWLMGARARFDSYGRLCGAELASLETLGRPRIDVVTSLSGIFRDLLPNQVRLLAEAARLAAEADEPVERNFVRKHALARAAETGCDLATAALRVFSNAEGAYGANVNHLVQGGLWREEDELAECFVRRKGHAFGADGRAVAAPDLLQSLLKDVSLSYQTLESAELGVTSIDHYFDALGGLSRAVARARGGEAAPAYIGDETGATGKVRTLAEQVALETRTRALNPRWYEALLAHGHEGVRQIEHAVTNTLGWSATTGQVAPWVYRELSATFVLDEAMRERLASLNPAATGRMTQRLIEAGERRYWTPDPATLDALHDAADALEDQVEGLPSPPPSSSRPTPSSRLERAA